MSEVDRLKERNFITKVEHKERATEAKLKIMRERMHNKEIKQIVSKVLEEKRSRDREEDINHKKSKKFHLLYEKNQVLSKKIMQLEDHHINLKQGYSSRLVEKQVVNEGNRERIKKLE